jgi:hypothetical protein
MFSRAQAIQTSTLPGLSEDRVVLTAPPGSQGQTFGIVVINNAPLTEATRLRS